MLQIGWKVHKGVFRRVIRVFGVTVYERVLDPADQILAMEDFDDWSRLMATRGGLNG